MGADRRERKVRERGGGEGGEERRRREEGGEGEKGRKRKGREEGGRRGGRKESNTLQELPKQDPCFTGQGEVTVILPA